MGRWAEGRRGVGDTDGDRMVWETGPVPTAVMIRLTRRGVGRGADGEDGTVVGENQEESEESPVKERKEKEEGRRGEEGGRRRGLGEN